MTTHYEGCWRAPGHHDCAVAIIKSLLIENDSWERAVTEARGEAHEARGNVRKLQEAIMQLEDARKQPWRYVDSPEDGADPRCLVTLEEDGMRWVGIRAWNANTGQWLNGGEPERARVMAWQPLPVPASGYWQHGKLVNERSVA